LQRRLAELRAASGWSALDAEKNQKLLDRQLRDLIHESHDQRHDALSARDMGVVMGQERLAKAVAILAGC